MTDDPLIGRQLANFRLERVLGRGGMAQVYYGVDVKLQRPVAVKVIDARFRDNPLYAKRFVREAQAVASWRHEHIAQIYYADEADGLYYFAMEFIDGLDLGKLLSQYAVKGELMPQADVLRIGKAIASALDYAHGKRVVHRDVKPSNVIIARDGRVVLSDFGLALDVQQGSVGEAFGSAHYIAPEQARRSSDATPQSDLYSLGIILYEMLTGVTPFDDPSATAVALQHITQPPPAPRTLNPRLTQEIEAVLLKALSKSPQERYQTGAALIKALETALNAGPATAQLAPLPPPPAGLQLPAQPSRLSQMSVSEVIAEQAMSDSPLVESAPRQTRPSLEKPPAQPHQILTRRPSFSSRTIGGCVLALILLIGVAGTLLTNPFDKGPENIASPSATLALVALVSPTLPIETQVTEPPVVAVEPTVKYLDGKRFMLFYDDSSLYLLNLSESKVPINWIAFERLSDADVPLNRFNGSRWAEFYANSDPGRCDALELIDRHPYLAPPECGKNNFLSLRTPTHDDPTVFWTTMEGSHWFRVLWREGGIDEEIARCEISAGTCEIFLP
jgi:serine/threonine protein kinase